MFYLTYILAIPLLYHCLYLLFFRDYIYENMSYIKVGLVFILMFYLTMIWIHIKELINQKKTLFRNNKNIIKYIIKILFPIHL
jgi:hypothetical protein